jgi:hypothetical protein
MVVELNIHQHIVSALVQSVFHSNDLQFLGDVQTHLLKLVIYLQDFSLFRGYFASKEVTNGKGHQIRRRGPL